MQTTDKRSAPETDAEEARIRELIGPAEGGRFPRMADFARTMERQRDELAEVVRRYDSVQVSLTIPEWIAMRDNALANLNHAPPCTS